jgi:hypothetical protein
MKTDSLKKQTLLDSLTGPNIPPPQGEQLDWNPASGVF